jgi:hypothetical protein
VHYLKRPPITGDAYLDHQTSCDRDPEGAACFLDDVQRERIRGDVSKRINDAGSDYRDAIQSARVDKLLEHEDADVPIVAAVLIGLAGGILTAELTAAVKALKSAASEALEVANAAVGGVSEEAEHSVMPIVANMSTTGIEGFIKAGEATARAHAFGKIAASAGRSDHDRKMDQVGYLDQLKAKAGVTYTGLREQADAHATDAELLALWKAFAPDPNRIERYQQQIAGHVERYAASNASKIGRDLRPSASQDDEQRRAGHVETRVAWVTVGTAKRLAYVERAFNYPYAVEADAYTETPMLSMADDATQPVYLGDGRHVTENAHFDSIDDADQFVSFVEDEFVGAAIDRHMALWVESPKTYRLELSMAGPRLVDPSTKTAVTPQSKSTSPKPAPAPQPVSARKPNDKWDTWIDPNNPLAPKARP